MSDTSKAFLAFVGGIALIPVSTVWGGYVLSIVWGWFVVPVFGLPALGIAQAIGLKLVSSFLTHQRIKANEGHDSYVSDFGFALLWPALVLLVGYIVTWWL